MNFIDKLLGDHYAELHLERYGLGGQWATVLLTPRFVTSRHLVALIFPAGERHPRLVVKVPRQPGDNEGVLREAKILRRLATLASGRVQGVPEVVAILNVGAHAVLVETALIGTPLDPGLVVRDTAIAVSAGTEFVSALPLTRPASANHDWYARAITNPLSALARLLSANEADAELIPRTHEILRPLRSMQMPAVVEHADLSHPNLFIQSDGTLQVMDWERSSLNGVPGHDLIFFLQFISESVRGSCDRESQIQAFDEAFGTAGWALERLHYHLKLRGVETDLLPLLVIMAWARSAATLTRRLAGTGPGVNDRAKRQAVIIDDRDFWLWRHAVNSMS